MDIRQGNPFCLACELSCFGLDFFFNFYGLDRVDFDIVLPIIIMGITYRIMHIIIMGISYRIMY